MLKENFEVLSEVKYSNVFIDGKCTHLQNGDHFVYISLDQIAKVLAVLHCKAFVARIIKPPQFQACYRCGQAGHKAASPDCPALAPEEVRQTIQPFRRGQNELSNLHVCPEGCAWQTNGQVFEPSEKEFQYRKLVHHEKDDEANHLLEIKSTVEIMQEARKVLTPNALDSSWLEKDESVMLDICWKKFHVCPHARQSLLEIRSEIAEATPDKKWGTGLNEACTQECLPDFWPGQNLMGKILKVIRTELLEEK